ncbi:endonuclease domain-containing protein [Oceanobacillus sp. CF4.6]|uniref:endonuclease domain-containing protein n=1 Tax=Oceanobacillus sp. CF4.6 TaxID=3373080 RepID=UPI003EE7583F
MKSYDAKNPHACKICGYQISHNKQGRFTSHLKVHGHTLNSYLVKFYYTEDELKCSRDTCTNLVNLTRGVPNKYCSKFCGSKKGPLTCILCGNSFLARNRKTKTCSKECAKSVKSTKFKQWHKSMSPEKKREHFNNIITKTAKTRRVNKTPSWNSGKTGIYSQETIEKIRNSTLKQMQSQNFRKTNIEKIMERFLIHNDIKYRYSFILKQRQYDFLLLDYNVIVECDGDYWHANPKFFPIPQDWQVKRQETDLIKNEIAEKNGYVILRFWEDDILNNFQTVESAIYDLLAKTKLETVSGNAEKQ